MTKSDIIKKIHSENDLNYVDVAKIVNQTFEEISKSLAKEDKVVISGFGTFEKYYQEGYYGLNPSTGEKLFVEGNYKIRFSSSRKLKELTNKK